MNSTETAHAEEIPTPSKQTAGRCRHAPAGFFDFAERISHHFDDAVFFHLDGHPVLHIGQEFIAEAVDQAIWNSTTSNPLVGFCVSFAFFLC